MSECKICAAKMPLNHRRYGGPCCNACAAFFQRSIKMQDEFECQNLNQCLKEASKIGKHCQKCRFAKCLEIGMISREYLNSKREEENESKVVVPKSEETSFAQTIEIMLNTSLQLPSYMEDYLENGNPEIIKISLELVKNINDDDPLTERVKLLSALFSKNAIIKSELPLFSHICFCRLEYPRFSESRKQRMKVLQDSAFQKLPFQSVEGHRFLDLIILSKRFLEIFYANQK